MVIFHVPLRAPSRERANRVFDHCLIFHPFFISPAAREWMRLMGEKKRKKARDESECQSGYGGAHCDSHSARPHKQIKRQMKVKGRVFMSWILRSALQLSKIPIMEQNIFIFFLNKYEKSNFYCKYSIHYFPVKFSLKIETQWYYVQESPQFYRLIFIDIL